MAKRSRADTPPPRPEMLAFLRQSKEDPENDTPRLIFADWLEERGDPRGEFIRQDCPWARLPQGDPLRIPVGKRVNQLREQHQAVWLGLLRGLPSSFCRGRVRLLSSGRDDHLTAASGYRVNSPQRRWRVPATW